MTWRRFRTTKFGLVTAVNDSSVAPSPATTSTSSPSRRPEHRQAFLTSQFLRSHVWVSQCMYDEKVCCSVEFGSEGVDHGNLCIVKRNGLIFSLQYFKKYITQQWILRWEDLFFKIMSIIRAAIEHLHCPSPSCYYAFYKVELNWTVIFNIVFSKKKCQKTPSLISGYATVWHCLWNSFLCLGGS